jgi:hypothetical protein
VQRGFLVVVAAVVVVVVVVVPEVLWVDCVVVVPWE